MIYISTACLENVSTVEAVELLGANGFDNIELSGGRGCFEKFEKELIGIKRRYDLNFICHNYFFRPKEPFVLNMASLNNDHYHKSLSYLKEALRLANRLGSPVYGFHAGFFIDIDVKKIGNDLNNSEMFDKEAATQKFCAGYDELKKEVGDVALYIENNVISFANLKAFNGMDPFMLTDYKGYKELRGLIDYKLMLDIGHLKVSAHSLNLDFEDQLNNFLPVSDYLHISDNDGFSDQNKDFSKTGRLYNILKNHNLKNKIITLEVYEGMEIIKDSYNLMMDAVGHGN